MTRPILIGALLSAAAFAPAPAQDWASVSAIFEERCVVCHSGEDAPLGLALDSYDHVLAGSENGKVVAPEAPETSPLLQRLTGAAEPQMPLDGPPFLEDGQIAAISAWMKNGAPGPEEAAAASAESAAAPDPYADGAITYGEVKRIFMQRCIECHSDNSKMPAPPEGLRLTSLEQILAGGDRAVVIPGNPEASEIIRRVEGLGSPRMPFDGPPWLSEAQIKLLKDWIAGGALDDDKKPAPIPVGARVRFYGVMTGPDEIDGARFTITDSTRVRDRPGVGMRAELRGRVGPDGAIIAERLRAR